MKLFLAILVVLAATAGPATAAPRLVAPSEAVGNPAFAGDEVVYGAQTSKGTQIRAIGPDGSRRVLDTLPIGPSVPDPFDDGFGDYRSLSTEVRGSSEAVAAFAQGTTSDRYGGWIFRHGAAGLFSGPFERFNPHCLTEQYPRAARQAIDVHGARVAFVGEACPPSRPVERRVTIRDLSKGTVVRGPAAASHEVRLAGRYVAYRPAEEPRAVVVYDLDAQQVITTVADAGSRFDVQADGKLAAGPAPGDVACRRGVRWYAPGDDAERVVAGCDSALIAIDGDHIGLWRQSPRGLAVLGLDGVSREINIPGTLAFDSADLSGNRIAFSTVGCSRDTGAVWLDDGGDRSMLIPEELPCRAEAPRATLSARRGFVRVPVTCRTGCRGALVVRGGRRYREELGFGLAFEVPAGKTKRVLADVGDLRRRFKGRRTINVRVEIRVNAREGLAYTRTLKVLKLKL